MKAGPGAFEGLSERGPSRRPPRSWLAFFACVLGALSSSFAQDLESARASLRTQINVPDFAERLEVAVDRATAVEDALALLSEFTPAVRDGGLRRAFLLRWAALLELTGRWEEAAARYDDAAFAEPGRRDTASLISEARALLAAGETEKALSILKVLEIASSDPSVRETAGILKGWARLIEGTPEEARILAGQVVKGTTNPGTRLDALTLLWASSEDADRAAAAARIRAEFPGTPEAVMTETGNVPAYGHWLLTRASGSAPPEMVRGTSPKGATESTPSMSGPKGESSVASGAADTTSSARIVAYQVGAFARQENANALSKELSKKGIPYELARKEREGGTIWSVLVPAGEDPQATLLRLKDAGYEAYPIF